MTGPFTDTIRLGATTLISAGRRDVFVAKLTPAGIYAWAVRAGGWSDDEGTFLTVYPAGGVVLTGAFTGVAADFGATTLVNTQSSNVAQLFVARLDATGAWQWAVAGQSLASTVGQGITADAAGAIYITGQFNGQLTLNATTVRSAGSSDMFVAKLTPAGLLSWLTSTGGAGSEVGYGVGVAATGEVVVAGLYGSPAVSFGGITLQNAGTATQGFVAQLSAGGVWQWAVSANGQEGVRAENLSVDAAGRIVFAGTFGGTTTFGPFTHTTNGALDLYVAQLSATGAWEWVTTAGGALADQTFAVTRAATGEVFATGFFASPTLTLGPATLTSAGTTTGFVAQLSAAGVWQWATSATSGADLTPRGIGVDGAGRVIIAGSYRGTNAQFGALTLPAALGQGAGFVAQLTAVPLAVPALPAEAPALILAPNPAHHLATLTTTPSTTVTLLDATGRAVLTSTADAAGAATLPVAGLPPGVYVVRAGATARKLVVE